MSDDLDISKDRCSRWRTKVDNGKYPYSIAKEEGLYRAEVLKHILGDCSHSSDGPTADRVFRMGLDECEEIRSSFQDGVPISELLNRTGRTWKTITQHLTGECNHGSSQAEDTVDRDQVLTRDSISEEDCKRFRREVQDAENVKEYSESIGANYQIVLTHVNGQCSHNIDVPARDIDPRSDTISKIECKNLREAYREEVDVNFEEFAERFDCAPETAERHVKFGCSHPPHDSIVTTVDDVRDILEGYLPLQSGGVDHLMEDMIDD